MATQYKYLSNNNYWIIPGTKSGLRSRVGVVDYFVVYEKETALNVWENVGGFGDPGDEIVSGGRCRMGVRGGNWVIDIELSATGFSGTEDTDWKNIGGVDLYVPTVTYDDWYLGSQDDMIALWDNIYDYYWNGEGGEEENHPEPYDNDVILTSTEESDTECTGVDFNDGSSTTINKADSYYGIPIRSFIGALGDYSLRDDGPAGGWIFNIVDNGGDTYTYFEAIKSEGFLALDGFYGAWSDVDDTEIGTTSSSAGTGQSNTDAIIDQDGHTASVAKECDDYSITI